MNLLWLKSESLLRQIVTVWRCRHRLWWLWCHPVVSPGSVGGRLPRASRDFTSTPWRQTQQTCSNRFNNSSSYSNNNNCNRNNFLTAEENPSRIRATAPCTPAAWVRTYTTATTRAEFGSQPQWVSRWANVIPDLPLRQAVVRLSDQEVRTCWTMPVTTAAAKPAQQVRFASQEAEK